MQSPDRCSHGVIWDAECIACDRVWHEAMLKAAEASVHEHRQRLAEIERHGERRTKRRRSAAESPSLERR